MWSHGPPRPSRQCPLPTIPTFIRVMACFGEPDWPCDAGEQLERFVVQLHEAESGSFFFIWTSGLPTSPHAAHIELCPYFYRNTTAHAVDPSAPSPNVRSTGRRLPRRPTLRLEAPTRPIDLAELWSAGGIKGPSRAFVSKALHFASCGRRPSKPTFRTVHFCYRNRRLPKHRRITRARKYFLHQRKPAHPHRATIVCAQLGVSNSSNGGAYPQDSRRHGHHIGAERPKGPKGDGQDALEVSRGSTWAALAWFAMTRSMPCRGARGSS